MADDLDIRRADLKGVRRTGTVRWFKDEKGYGRITADDGEVLFVHFSGIEGDGYRALDAGDRVSFVWNDGVAAHGRHAATAVRLEPPPAERARRGSYAAWGAPQSGSDPSAMLVAGYVV